MNTQAEHPEGTDVRAPSPASIHDPRAPSQRDGGEEISLRELLQILLGYRKAIIRTVVATTIVSGLYAFTAPKHYIADTLISPVDNSAAQANRSALAGQLGGLASLAGVSVNSDSDKGIAIATLSSRILIEGMIRDENLLPIIFKSRWDAEKNDWKSSDPQKVPTLLDGYKAFQKSFEKIEEDKKKSLVTLSIEWTSPEQAAHWTNELVKRANELLRQRALDESGHNLAYLQEEAQKTSVVELRQAIYGLMEGELKKSMIAKGNDQYAFKVIDPAVVPEKKSSPKRTLILIVGFLGGWFLGGIGALAHRALKALNLRGIA